MAPHAHDNGGGKKASATARMVGAGTAGALELICFHPVDTIAKRLMSNTSVKIMDGGGLAHAADNAAKVIFKDAYAKPAGQRYLSLFPGIGFAAGYKVLQRVYKFGGQPVVKDYIKSNHGDAFSRVFGERSSKTWMEATAGSIVGIGEIVLLPLDVLKIKSQTNPEALKGRGLVDLFVKEGRELYRGAGWTAARNAPGSFALFGGNQFAKTYLVGLKDSDKPTFLQLSMSSMVGSVASIVVAAPLDVVKTRIQNRPFDSPESGSRIIMNMIRNEGVGSFFKGLGPKVLVVGPKLIFSFTIAQYLIAKITESMD
ncbi:mitochondrial carrier domain-containing protein [Blastocladiella britannica]|nr:mitochondrial carrier domain-containing protein [Blastocladiella britannica]